MSYKLTKDDKKILKDGEAFMKEPAGNPPAYLQEKWKKDNISLSENIKKMVRKD